ncbi:hypothetical protein MATL_G00002630 [Megalops atlanticus]|uniref:Uncharacterized protein n=1 Tax=Megalops atlanticus TaxID=7932 RepID=A0A9D3TDS3_MEGAT|nr:hypothetical protein MATL_G00002630 [Megalops atlanticus]
MAVMEGFLLQAPAPMTLLGAVLVLLALYLLSPSPGSGREPPGPRPLPLLGNLLLLDLKNLHASLCELSKKHGSVFTVHFGPKKVVVLAGYKTVKQALVDYAEEFGERDVTPIFRDVLQGHGCEEKIIQEVHHLAEVFEQFKDASPGVALWLFNLFPWLGRCLGQWLGNRALLMKNSHSNTEEMKGLVKRLQESLNPQHCRCFVDCFLIRQREFAIHTDCGEGSFCCNAPHSWNSHKEPETRGPGTSD